jgi:sugar/nucleoside kinase (ribokinase family)
LGEGRVGAAVFGNATLDVLCSPVDDVPRHESIAFDRAAIGPGGCGSNVAIGLSALGVSTALVACIGADDAGALIERAWEQAGVDTRFVRRLPGVPTAVSVGLVDSAAQPRFVHTPGANAGLTADDLDLSALAAEGARALHVGGFLVLPGVPGTPMAGVLAEARGRGLITTLDVAVSSRSNPDDLWPCIGHLDLFLCNAREARHLTGKADPASAARALRDRGARAVVVKLGADGCRVVGDGLDLCVPAEPVDPVDSTGAGDAFAAGLISALLRGAGLEEACRAGNEAGARVLGALGAVAAWLR